MTFIINQVIIAFWNIVNSRLDAYRILANKKIAHGINFGAYSVLVGVLIWAFRLDLRDAILLGFSAFFQRQLTFDIPLNLRRGLPWFYQSMDKPPKALLDKIERKLFGIDYDGKKIVFFYSVCYATILVINYFK